MSNCITISLCLLRSPCLLDKHTNRSRVLTSIIIRSFVLDVSRELGEYIISRCVWFPILCCKFGIPNTQEHSEKLGRLSPFPVCVYGCETYFGGASISSRYSSTLLTSVSTSPWKVRKGGCVPGAKLWRSAGFLIRREWIYNLNKSN